MPSISSDSIITFIIHLIKMRMNQLKKTNFRNTLIFTFIMGFALLFSAASCKKDNSDPGFKADFTFDYLEGNYVQFTNTSEGDYYWMIWNFGNGVSDTTTDKKKSYQIYYPEAGDFDAKLQLINNTGSNQSTTKSVSIEATDLILSFTATVDPENPNYVTLVNTTTGEIDSFLWEYRNIEVPNEMVHEAYFPQAGNYVVELQAIKNNVQYSTSNTVNITQDDPNANPNLIWSEEFEYTGSPDPAKWNMETGGGGWGNNELQYYTNDQSNAMAENGVLTITAREESFGGRDYTSARMTTQNKFDFKYGRIEARIKLPYGQGLWPAFWMLGRNINSVSWPACGEIDIMEMIGGTGNDKKCHATLHWENANGDHGSYGESYTLPSGILADDFHVFAVEWNNQEIKAYIDDVKYYTINLTESQFDEFRQNFFIIMNVAVGGNWPGSPDGSTTFPQTMQVDWVRVYQE